MPLQDANPTPSFGGFGIRMTRWSLFLQTPNSYETVAAMVTEEIIVNDTGVDGPSVSVMLSAVRLRLIQTGRLYNYGMAMVLGVVGLALVWWVAL